MDLHREPRHQRIGGKHDGSADRNGPGSMQHVPDPSGGTERGGGDRVREVVQNNDGDADFQQVSLEGKIAVNRHKDIELSLACLSNSPF